jgi:hypothetical protein
LPPASSFEEQPGTAHTVTSSEAASVVHRRNERISELQ